jgi:hypothetical protein
LSMPRWSSRSGRHSPMRSLSFANAASERIRPRMRPCREHNRAAPRQLGQGNDAPPTQFLWRSHAQLGAPHRRAIPDALRRENEGLREGTHGRRQDLAGDPALPEALRRSRALSTSRERALTELTTYRNVGSGRRGRQGFALVGTRSRGGGTLCTSRSLATDQVSGATMGR